MFNTNYDKDQFVLSQLKRFKDHRKKYNGLSCNCTDYAKTGAEAASDIWLFGTGEILDGQLVNTPNKLYKAVEAAGNAKIIKNPGSYCQ